MNNQKDNVNNNIKEKPWIKFGSILIGYNYDIVKECSEATAKTVKRYTSAILIVCILWAFIGFTFSQRYLKMETFGSIITSLIFVLIVIQIERQIILASHNSGFFIFRIFIGIMMAIIGSVIIDQIIFKEDIEQKKILLLDERVNKAYELKNQEFIKEIEDKTSEKKLKENELSRISAIVDLNPLERIYTVRETTTQNLDPNTNQTTSLGRNTVTEGIDVPNHLIKDQDALRIDLERLQQQINEKDSLKWSLRNTLEDEIKSKVGFLDELTIMVKLFSDSSIAFFAWLIWFLLLSCLELFVVFSKLGDKDDTDYDDIVKHGNNINKKRLNYLAEKAFPKSKFD
jgi:hypothetical protein